MPIKFNDNGVIKDITNVIFNDNGVLKNKALWKLIDAEIIKDCISYQFSKINVDRTKNSISMAYSWAASNNYVASASNKAITLYDTNFNTLFTCIVSLDNASYIEGLYVRDDGTIYLFYNAGPTGGGGIFIKVKDGIATTKEYTGSTYNFFSPDYNSSITYDEKRNKIYMVCKRSGTDVYYRVKVFNPDTWTLEDETLIPFGGDSYHLAISEDYLYCYVYASSTYKKLVKWSLASKSIIWEKQLTINSKNFLANRGVDIGCIWEYDKYSKDGVLEYTMAGLSTAYTKGSYLLNDGTFIDISSNGGINIKIAGPKGVFDSYVNNTNGASINIANLLGFNEKGEVYTQQYNSPFPYWFVKVTLS